MHGRIWSSALCYLVTFPSGEVEEREDFGLPTLSVEAAPGIAISTSYGSGFCGVWAPAPKPLD